MALERDRGLRALHLRDLDVDDLRLVVLRLDLRRPFPAAATAGATAKAVAMAPMVAMRFMVLLPPRRLHVTTVRAGGRRVVRGRDVANVTAVTQTSVMDWSLLAELPAEDVASGARDRAPPDLRQGRGRLPSRRPGRLAAPGRARPLRRSGADAARRQRARRRSRPGTELRRARPARPRRAALGDRRGARGRGDALCLPRRLRRRCSARIRV